MDWLISLAQVSRAGWRAVQKQPNARREENKLIEEHIMAIHHIHPYYGYLRMTTALRKEGFLVNHKRVYRLMGRLQIRSVIRKKRRYHGRQVSMVYPNRLERHFAAERPLEKLVTDITYLRVGERYLYLSAVQDLFNNEIVAWSLSEQNDVALVGESLKKLPPRIAGQETILHSDHISKPYNGMLQKHRLIGSHSRRVVHPIGRRLLRPHRMMVV
jgi:putative transposase